MASLSGSDPANIAGDNEGRRHAPQSLRARPVIHDDGVVALQSWSQALLHIIKERLSFHSAVNHTWRCHSVAAQSAHEGDRFPVAVRNPANQALAALLLRRPQAFF